MAIDEATPHEHTTKIASRLNDSSSPTSVSTTPDKMPANDHCFVDNDSQVIALMEAINLLSKIANYNGDTDSTALIQLQELQKEWNLQDTPIPRLLNAIQGLQSTSQHLHQDADTHVAQVQSLQEELRESRSMVTKLETALQKVCRKNERLQLKLEQKDRERKSILKLVRDYVQQVKQHEQDNSVVHQLYCHERLLKLENQVKQNEAHAGNRSRCSSRDTVLSDVTHDEDKSHSSSVSSLITDEGMATVRYSPAIVEDDRTLSWNEKPHDLELAFPQGRKIGLQFHKILVEPKGLLNDALDDNAGTAISPSQAVESTLKHFHLESLLKPQEEYAYVVCGHFGFDSAQNKEPAMGARLVKVNEQLVDNWTLDQIRETLKSSNTNYITMTFRNEPLSPRQKLILYKAIHANKQQYEEQEENGGGEQLAVSEHSSVILDLHHHEDQEETLKTPGRFSSLIQSARSRLDSDPDDSVMREMMESSSSSQDLQAPASTPPKARRLSSFLSGARSRLDTDSSIEVTNSDDTPGEATPVADAPPSQKFKKFLNSARSRAHTDPCVTMDDIATPNDDNGDASQKLKSSMASMGTKILNSARSRLDTDSSVIIDTETVETPNDDSGADNDTSFKSSMASMGSKILNSTRSRLDKDSSMTLDTDNVETATGEEDTTQKLKKSMTNMGSKFKSMF